MLKLRKISSNGFFKQTDFLERRKMFEFKFETAIAY